MLLVGFKAFIFVDKVVIEFDFVFLLTLCTLFQLVMCFLCTLVMVCSDI